MCSDKKKAASAATNKGADSYATLTNVNPLFDKIQLAGARSDYFITDLQNRGTNNPSCDIYVDTVRNGVLNQGDDLIAKVTFDRSFNFLGVLTSGYDAALSNGSYLSFV